MESKVVSWNKPINFISELIVSNQSYLSELKLYLSKKLILKEDSLPT